MTRTQPILDTDLTNRPTEAFRATGVYVILPARGGLRWTYVYRPTTEAKRWDGVDGRAEHALGSRHGGYSYANVTVTGTKARKVPGVPATYGIKARIEIGLLTGVAEDVETVDAWVILDNLATTPEDIRRALAGE